MLATDIAHPPVFIIGHWRSGTTHLHNLLSKDPNLGFASTLQTVAPASFLVGRSLLRPLVARSMPDRRRMDNMALSVDLPQEEEYAMCNVCPHSFYVGWYFPRRMPELFRKYVLFEGISDQELREWRTAYLGVLRKATLHAGGKRLVLKNPVNTARLKHLLELFPDAKFIHIYRNPYTVFRSTQRLHRAALDMVSFQEVSDAAIETNVLTFYHDMMRRFFRDKDLIPAGNFAEVRFEDFEQRPMTELARVYESLGLPGWGEACSPMEEYLATQAGYKKNHCDLTQDCYAKVERYWQFAVEAWGYQRPEPEAA